MVVAQEPLAADVGLDVLRHGGNAVDAAVAVGFALAVTHPEAGNIGGGGFMLIRLADGKSTFLDFREMAPAAATRDMYIGPDGKPTRDSVFGWRSAGVPGTVAGLSLALEKYGSQPWAAVLQPAIRLARDGFPVTPQLLSSLQESRSHFPIETESKRIFTHGGAPLSTGELLQQPDLAHTLTAIAEHGAKDFYSGAIAQQFASEMAKHHGLITLDDLKNYHVVERAPLTGAYHGYQILTAPPPSAGGVGLLQMLGILDGTGFDSEGPNSVKAIHYEAEAMRRAYADRSAYLGDPDFYNVPVRQLLDPKYLAWRRSTISPREATPGDAIQPGLPAAVSARNRWPQHESTETTHYNVVDSAGNAVAVTYTLNNSYGNGITVPGLGFLLNDEMDDFVAKPGAPNMFGLVGGDANAIEPRKRPLSSMTPTIVTRDNRFFMAVGAPGGATITTGVMQVVVDVLDFHLSPQPAVDLPRFHDQWKPDILSMENGFPRATLAALGKMGYVIEPIAAVGRVEAIVNAGGHLEGGVDPRQGGKIASY